MRKGVTVAVGLVAMAVSGVALGGSAGARGSARQAGSPVRFQDVSAESATDVWAVGSTGGDSPEPAIAHWNGTALSEVPTNLGSGGPGGTAVGELHGVSADAPTDVWAVGNEAPPRTHMVQSLVMRWDGTSWSRVPSPNPSALANDMTAVRANGPDDVWVRGSYFDQSTHRHPVFVTHWDGQAWATVRLPKAIARQVQLFGFRSFDPVGPRAAYAIGSHVAPNGIKSDEVLRWNGQSWSKAHAPFYGAALSGIGASSAGDVWAVGYNCVLRNCPPFHTATYHWDGRKWKGGVFYKRGDPYNGFEVIPSASEADSKLVTVTSHTPSDAWATGTCSGHCSHGRAFLLHWDGKAWSRLPSPGASLSSAISSVSGTDAWVVGGGSLLHWDGSSWSSK